MGLVTVKFLDPLQGLIFGGKEALDAFSLDVERHTPARVAVIDDFFLTASANHSLTIFSESGSRWEGCEKCEKKRKLR